MRSFVIAALAAAGLGLAATSGAFSAPIAPLGQATNVIDSREVVHYYGYHRHRHHRRCWWRHGHRHCRW
jgi:hypothetical protein